MCIFTNKRKEIILHTSMQEMTNNKERPNYLSRSNRSCNTSTGLDEPVKPKFTRFVKGKPC